MQYSLRLPRRSTCVVLVAVAFALTFGRLLLPFVMRHWAVSRFEQHDWVVVTASEPPDWLPGWAEDRTEAFWIAALTIHGPPRDAQGAVVRVADLEWLRWLPEVQCSTSLSSAGLARLSASKSLARLVLEDTPVSGDALEALLQIPTLKVIWLTPQQMEAPDIARLKSSARGRYILKVDPTEQE